MTIFVTRPYPVDHTPRRVVVESLRIFGRLRPPPTGTPRALEKVMANSKKTSIVADICLYGNRETGAGWLASHAGGRLGNGETRSDRTFTEAIWMAVEALRDAGVRDGRVAIYAPGGERVAYARVGMVPAFGSLTWEPAPVYTVSVETLVAAAARS